MGASLLSFFVSAGVGLGIGTILIAHIMFSISFVAVVVRARVLTLDPNIEEAARDLGAGPLATFWLVTFPMIFPAVLSGGLLAFALSIDDFVITNFTAGTTTTFPLWIWGATRVGLPPQVNVMGTLIFAVGVLIAVASAVNARRAGPAVTRADRRATCAGRWPTPRPRPFWLDQAGRAADRRYPLAAAEETDLAVIGGGFSGLWTALLAKERDPARDVVLLEGRTIGWAASGRNGGFCSASLTHGLANGARPLPRRDRRRWSGSGRANLDEIEATVRRYGIDCDFVRTGELTVAPRALAAAASSRRTPSGPAARGGRFEVLDAGRRSGPRSTRPPTWAASGTATAARMVDPARLAWGLRRGLPGDWACASTSSTPVRAHRAGRRPAAPAHRARAAGRRPGRAGHRAPRPGCCAGWRHYVVPVYDYALMTEPLSARAARRRSAGPTGRASATRPTSSTTTGSPPTTGSCGAATTPSTTPAGGSRPARDQRPQTFLTAGPALLRDVPAAARTCASPTGGAASSTPAAGSAPSSAGRTAGGWPTPSATPGSGVGATRFGAAGHARPARRRGDRADPAADGAQPAGAVPARAGAHRRDPADPLVASPGPTGTRAAATSGCAPSTASASASIVELTVPR